MNDDRIFEDIEKISNKLNELLLDVRVIKNTCKTRGTTCAKHVSDLDVTIRGNGKNGLVTRVNSLEQKSGSREKFVFLIMGSLGVGVISLLIALVINLFS
jgi:hypothetical protein